MRSFIEKLPHILDALGALFIAYAALRVHHNVLHEKQIDKRVFRIMKFEQVIGYTGVIMILIALVLNILI